MKNWHLPLLAILFIFVAACNKTEEIIIEDNTAPPDYTIPNIIKENYVNRAYIALLGRKPDPAEFSVAFNILDTGNVSMAARGAMLDIILGNAEFYQNQYLQAKSSMLNGIDDEEIEGEIFVLELLLTDPTYAALWDLFEYEIDRLDTLLATVSDLQSGSVPYKEMHRRMLDNAYYDQINMGSLNHVISSFQHLILRHPTEAELDQGIIMVDGFNSILFLESGSTKDDYHQILLNSGDYYEAQARDLFQRFIFREPTSDEMDHYANLYKGSDDYKMLIKEVLALDEYVGLD